MSATTEVAAGTAADQPTKKGKPQLSEGARAERRLGWLLCAPAIITVFSVSITLVLGMLLAFVMYRTLFGRGTVRTASLVPYGIVTVAAAYGWQYAWTPGQGYLSSVFNNSAPLTDEVKAIAVIILAEIWKTTPFMGLLLLAGLSLVPEDLQKAAKVDGASGWQRFWRITLPLIKPALAVAVLFRALDAFRIYDSVYIITNGSNNTSSVSLLGYQVLIGRLDLGLGSAIAVLIFLCVCIIAVAFFRFLGASPQRR